MPHPSVHWSQNLTFVRLIVKLQDVEKATVEMHLTADGLFKFEAVGTSASPKQLYDFSIQLDSEVFRKKPSCRYHAQYLEIKLIKEQPVYVNRLTPTKLAFLKIDFDRYMSQSDAEGEHEEHQIKVRVENRQKHSSFTKKCYLLAFNGTQTLLYSYIFLKCALGVATSTSKDDTFTFLPYYAAWQNLGFVVKIAQSVAFIETFNGVVGLSKTNAVSSFVQNFGRGVVVCCIMAFEEGGGDEFGVIAYLLLVWSFIEVIRYPMYILTLLKQKSALLTWLRYNAFVPLYPLGIVLEAATLLLTCWDRANKSQSIIPGLLVRGYMVLMVLGFSSNYKYMFAQRSKKYGGKKLKTK